MAYCHVTYEERKHIRALRENGESLAQIALRLNRHKSTISRELHRNCNRGSKYDASVAHKRANRRRRDAKRPRVLEAQPHLGHYVEQALRRGFSPEQLTGRRQADTGERAFSQRTVYRHLHRRRKAGNPITGPLVRWPQKRRKTTRPRRHIIGRVGIELRPAEVDKRLTIGHWEGDTICDGPGRGQVLVLTERYSRYTILRKLENRKASHVAGVAKKSFKALPTPKRSTLTLDNGLEFAEFPRLQGPLRGLRVYFCDPHSPWQRGLVENTNGLLRHYLPKGKPLHNVSQLQLNQLANALNHRPRKCLNYKTPTEIFDPG